MSRAHGDGTPTRAELDELQFGPGNERGGNVIRDPLAPLVRLAPESVEAIARRVATLLGWIAPDTTEVPP